MFEDINNGHTCYCENCYKLQLKLEKIKEFAKRIGNCEHCGYKIDTGKCLKECASYKFLQIINDGDEE